MVEITPYVGVGELQFSMHCDEVCDLPGRSTGGLTTGTPPATCCAPAS